MLKLFAVKAVAGNLKLISVSDGICEESKWPKSSVNAQLSKAMLL